MRTLPNYLILIFISPWLTGTCRSTKTCMTVDGLKPFCQFLLGRPISLCHIRLPWVAFPQVQAKKPIKRQELSRWKGMHFWLPRPSNLVNFWFILTVRGGVNWTQALGMRRGSNAWMFLETAGVTTFFFFIFFLNFFIFKVFKESI